MRVRTAILWVAAAVAGCGGAGDGSRSADVRAYGETAQQISAAASSYATAAAATIDVPGCDAAHGAYDGHVRPMVERMSAMSDGMDREMERMGHMGDADMTCGASAMEAELERHHVAACASADMAANHAEAARHAAEMQAWAEHQRRRADQMSGGMGTGSGMGGGMGSGEGMPTCRQNDDGSFTLEP